jgi:hypothetical protein
MKGLSRRWIRFNVALQIGLAAAALVAANIVSFDLWTRADFSRNQKFSLAEQTKRVFRELQSPVTITVFFSPSTTSPVAAIFPDVKNLLDEFVFSGRRLVRVETIDPVRDLARANELQSKHPFHADENVLILEYEGRTTVLPVAGMADFDLGALEYGGSPRVLAFKGEQVLTSALMGLINPVTRRVYFLQGHGEPAVGDTSKISGFLDYIRRQNVTVHPLNLASLDVVPPDASAVFVVSPVVDLQSREIEILRAYWEAEGRMMVLLDPAAQTPRLDAFLASAGLRPRGDRVLRTVRLGFATGILREVTAEFYPRSPVTRRLAGLTLFLPGQTQSLALEPPPDDPLALRPLLQPAEEFWGEKDHVTDPSTGVRYDEGRDTGQPLYVAASSERGGIADDRVTVASAKLVVAGNASFALDAALSAPGLDFLVSATHWLLERGELAGVAPKLRQYFNLNLDEQQTGLLSALALLVMPGAAALLAAVIWLQRRS